MSTSVGQIHYELDLDTSKFDAKASSIRQKLSNAGRETSTFGDRLKDVGKSAVIAGAGIGAMVAVLNPFIQDAAKRLDTMNNFPKVMSNMGISATDASKAIDKIDQGIRGLPTPLDTATLAVQRLTSKTQDVDKSTDIFLALNNAVIAGGAPMELQATATEQFAQAFAKGRPDMMEWRSMLAAMPAQLSQVAKHMKLASADELGEKLRDGTISMEEFSDALITLNSTGVGGLPNFAEQAKNASNGLGTAMANAKTAVTRGIAKIMDSIGSSRIAEFITNVGKKLETVFQFIADHIQEVAVFIGVILAGAFAVLAVKVILATWPILAIAAAVTLLFMAYKKFKPQIDAVIEKFKEFWNLIKPIRDFVVGQLVSAWKNFIDMFKNLMKTLQPIMPVLKVLGVILLVSVLAPILAIIATVAAFILILSGIIWVVKKVWHAIEVAWGFIKNVTLTVWNAIWTVISTVFSAIWNVVSTVFSAIWNFISPILSFILDLFTIVFGAILLVVVFVVKSIYERIVSVITTLYNIWKTIWDAVYEVVSTIWNAIYGVISDIVGKIINFFAPAATWLWDKGVAIVRGLVNGIVAVAREVWNAIKSVADQIGNFFAGAWNWLYDTGRAIIQGLINGIGSLAGRVRDKVAEIADSVKNKIKDALGIRSPSRVMMELGMQTGEGFARGIQDSLSLIRDASNSLYTPMVDNPNNDQQTSGASTTIYGNVNIGSRQDTDYFFRRLNNNQDALGLGLAGSV